MIDILDLFSENETVKEIINRAKNSSGSLYCRGMTENHKILLAASLFKNTGKSVVYVCKNAYGSERAFDMFSRLLGDGKTCLYAADDPAAIEADIVSDDLLRERLRTMKKTTEGEKAIIATHPEALLRPFLSRKKIEENKTRLRKGEEKDISELVRKLTRVGYCQSCITRNPGEFSVRGEILDVFPVCSPKPIRIDFGFDEIEKIKFYDPVSQLTEKENLREIVIMPAREEKEEEACEDCDSFFGEEYYFVFDEIRDIEKAAEEAKKENERFFEGEKRTDFKEFEEKQKRKIYFSSFGKDPSGKLIDGLWNLGGYATPEYNNDFKTFVADIKSEAEISGFKTYVLSGDSSRLVVIKELLSSNGIAHDNGGNVITGLCKNAMGFGFRGVMRAIADTQIFGGRKRQRLKRHVTASVSDSGESDLKPGDYVVHYDYGIGKYLGIETVELNGIETDYLKLQYENMQLLVPPEKADLPEKYTGGEGCVPKLSKIGTGEWEKKKTKIRDRLRNIAGELIDLQVKRAGMKGVRYRKDSELQELFEAGFVYEPTPDQERITKEIKKEMEEGVLVDRLICGDVGYGKTEIAMRIAFKTVYEGKQVLMMAPTTILSLQHYRTFTERFSPFGISIGLLNRLVDPAKRKRTIEEAASGKTEIIIGTHRLSGDDISYHDLGLLIIDEEQRFGVEHKEKIKQMKNGINVLTLSATPIPRTLQMAIAGIRSMSLLETPPRNRFPIKTYVTDENEGIIRHAVYRELARGGQVFYLHNRIGDIGAVADKIRKLVPEAKVEYIHGRMDRETLENTVLDFIDGYYDVLVCTTIVETGIDIPNANTLICDGSDRLGLSQMYQIRGRVGRTNKIAYAYFMYRKEFPPTETARERLKAIADFTALGSGYKIAARDLAIRGAGDILGKEQSGFIETIGIEMYLKLLREAVDLASGKKEKETPAVYRIGVSKHIERDYVKDDAIIVYIHKQINAVDSKEDKEKAIKEITDRFGKPSEKVLVYIEEKYLESLFRKLKVVHVGDAPNLVTVILPRETSMLLHAEDLLREGYAAGNDFSFDYRAGRFIVKCRKEENSREWVYQMAAFFGKTVSLMEKRKQKAQ